MTITSVSGRTEKQTELQRKPPGAMSSRGLRVLRSMPLACHRATCIHVPSLMSSVCGRWSRM